jgi:TPR repeat protein
MAGAGETDVCGICLEPLPRWGDQVIWLSCCGKGMHTACSEELQASAHRNKCPMCRAPAPSTVLESHRCTLKWAERGKGWAMVMIASDYEHGIGVQKSHKTARLWSRRAAEQGDARAQFKLAAMHRVGNGGPVSMEQARVWCGRAAEQGYAVAQCNLAIMHEKGDGGPVSMEQARVWFGRAAEQGYAQAQYYLAVLHYKGRGGPVSMEQAQFWYRRAAEQGHAKAQGCLSLMHFGEGHGGHGGSLEHGIFWLRRAAAQGDDSSMHHVREMESTCFSCGKRRANGERNMKKCMGCKCAMYCSKGCQRAHWKKKNGGHKTACKNIQALKLKMTGDAKGVSAGSAAGGAGESKANGGDGGAAGAAGAVAATTKKSVEK